MAGKGRVAELRKPVATDPVQSLIEAERARLLEEAGLIGAENQYRRPRERPFTAEERSSTTILFGNLTWKHEAFIKAVFCGCGYRCESLPTPTKSAFQTGKEYCNNGLCNPNYFTAGNLIQYLRRLEVHGLSREQIANDYIYFTAGGCGPCRFGMYESEYRQALHNAGYAGFRVLTFQGSKVLREGSQEPGLKYTMDFGLGMLNALNLGDVLYDLAYQIRPYEMHPGETDRVVKECVADLAEFLCTRSPFEILERAPRWLGRWLARRTKWKNLLNNLGKFHQHLYGEDFLAVLRNCARRLNQIEVDRTHPRPVVKITGEFFSQLAEGDANYSMFAFLEQEGAEVSVDPIASLVLYWLYQARLKNRRRKGLDVPYERARWWQLRRRLANHMVFLKKEWLLALAERTYTRQYRRVVAALGGLAHLPAGQAELAGLAAPYYDPLTRGGEGHLEVAKGMYYAQHRLSHMVLSLKPFGCMPSTQSDGVMAAVAGRHREMLFLAVETSGEGEINAYSRVQMALGEAKRRARAEFEAALQSTGKQLGEIEAYVLAHPDVRRPFYRFPRHPGTAGVSANFIRHISDRMDRERGASEGRRP